MLRDEIPIAMQSLRTIYRGIATIEGNCLSKSFSPSIACNSFDFPNSYYHAIDTLKFSQCLGKKYTLATPLIYHTILPVI